MLVALTNQKGGVGKSTIAVHLAVWYHERGCRVALIDADTQGSSSRWIATAEPGVHAVALHHPDDIIEQSKALLKHYDLIVADGPPGVDETTRALLLRADLALVPCGPSLLELEAAAAAIRVIKGCQDIREGKPLAMLVLSRLRQDRFNLTREAKEAAATLGLPVCRNAIRFRDVVADAAGQRSVLWRMGARAAVAANEMRNVISEIAAHDKAKNFSRRSHRRAKSVHRGGKENANHNVKRRRDAAKVANS